MRSTTDRQQQILVVIRGYIAEHGYPPSLRNIADACGLSTITTVSYHLQALAAAGYIRLDAGRRRAITILGEPMATEETVAAEEPVEPTEAVQPEPEVADSEPEDKPEDTQTQQDGLSSGDVVSKDYNYSVDFGGDVSLDEVRDKFHEDHPYIFAGNIRVDVNRDPVTNSWVATASGTIA